MQSLFYGWCNSLFHNLHVALFLNNIMQMEHNRKKCQEIGAIEEVKYENARIDFVPINEKNGQ